MYCLNFQSLLVIRLLTNKTLLIMILKKLNQFRTLFFIALTFTGFSFLSCDSENPREVELFEPGTINATSSSVAIKAGGTIDYSSTSTKVQSLSWTFQGGTPATSTEEKVTVLYKSGGKFKAQLVVKYIDNLTETKTFDIEVEAPPIPIIQGVGIYTERQLTATNAGKTPVNNGNMAITQITTGAYNGVNSLFYHYDPDGAGNKQTGFALSAMDLTTSPFDASAFNFLNIAVKSSTAKNVRIRLNTNSGNYWVVLKPSAPKYGMLWDGNWHELKIPFSDILKDGSSPALSATPAAKSSIKQFVMRTDDADYSTAANSWDYYIDDVYLTTN